MVRKSIEDNPLVEKPIAELIANRVTVNVLFELPQGPVQPDVEKSLVPGKPDGNFTTPFDAVNSGIDVSLSGISTRLRCTTSDCEEFSIIIA